jgi:hypothetical protein
VEPIVKELQYFLPKLVSKLSKILVGDLGSIKNPSRIPRVKKAADPGSATLRLGVNLDKSLVGTRSRASYGRRRLKSKA